MGKVGCPRRGLLLCSLRSVLAPGDPTGKKPQPQRGRAIARVGESQPTWAIHAAHSWIQPFTSAFTFDLSRVIPRTGEMALVISSHGEEKGDTQWDPCSPLPICTTLQLTVKTRGDRGGSIIASLCHLVAIRKKDKSK